MFETMLNKRLKSSIVFNFHKHRLFYFEKIFCQDLLPLHDAISRHRNDKKQDMFQEKTCEQIRRRRKKKASDEDRLIWHSILIALPSSACHRLTDHRFT